MDVVEKLKHIPYNGKQCFCVDSGQMLIGKYVLARRPQQAKQKELSGVSLIHMARTGKCTSVWAKERCEEGQGGSWQHSVRQHVGRKIMKTQKSEKG